MTLQDFYVETANGRVYFEDIRKANDYAQKLANREGHSIRRHDLYGGQSVFSPQTVQPEARKRT